MNRFRAALYLLAIAVTLIGCWFAYTGDVRRMVAFGFCAGGLVLVGHLVRETHRRAQLIDRRPL